MSKGQPCGRARGGGERALGAHLAVGTSGAFLNTCVLGWGCQPGISDLQQLRSPEMASQLPVQSRSYKPKGQLWRASRRPWLPTTALGKVYVPTSGSQETQSRLGSLVLTQVMAAEEKRGQGRHYWLLAEAGDWRGLGRAKLMIS